MMYFSGSQSVVRGPPVIRINLSGGPRARVVIFQFSSFK